MKKFLIGIFTLAIVSCNNGGSEGGTVDDGIKTVDTNGALNDNGGPLTDSTGNAIENSSRTDISTRDSSTKPGQ